VTELQLKTDTLPEAAKKELLNFYDYLVYKYLENIGAAKYTNTKTNKHVAAFKRFRRLRNQVNPVVDTSVNIDKLINEANNDIF
jgi:hypothetical protein